MAKTIFKTSEKSNFILNMTTKQYGLIASVGLIAACFAVSLFTAIPEITDSATYSISSAGLAVAGVICLITAFIGIIKKYPRRSCAVPLIAFSFMLLWSVISLIFSYDKTVSFYGFPQRGEGVLALIFYFAVFITAACLHEKKPLSLLVMGVMCVGLLNSVWALIQVFGGVLTNHSYLNISILVMTTAASGLSQSPVFLAMVLSLSLTAALTDSVLTESKKRRIFDIVCVCLFSFTIIFTYSLVGICGIFISIAASVIAAAAGKVSKKRLLVLLAVVLSAALAVTLAVTVKAGSKKGYHFYDGYTVWSDDAFMRIGSGGDYDPDKVDIGDPFDVYGYFYYKTADIIKEYPLTGTGPEQLVYPQLYTDGELGANASIEDIIPSNQGTFDKVYNEYVYTAATRGIPSAIALVILVISVMMIIKKRLKGDRSAETISIAMITLCGALMFLIGCSNITFSPIFWACAGAACAVPEIAPAEKNAAKGKNSDEKKQ